MADSTLHRRLHDELARLHDHLVACASCTTCEATAGYHALRAVVELHAPREDRIGTRLARLECQGCDVGGGYDWEYPSWPCSTIQVIARELGVDHDV